MNVALSEIANLINGEVTGNADITVTSLSPIDDIAEGSLVYADGKDNLKRVETSAAAAVLVNKNTQISSKPALKVDHPLKAFITLLDYFYPESKQEPKIHPTAVIAEDVQLGKEVWIGPYVVIEAGSIIGDRSILKSHVHIGRKIQIGQDTVIHPQVTIYDHSQIGNQVVIHASSVIGADGFGYLQEQGRHIKIPHKGKVIIEDEVEIGANTVIDRATLGATVIGKGTKIDNLVQVAHSVKLGQHNILCAFTGIAGSSVSGNHVIFAANVGVSDHVRIDDGVILGARTGVPPNKHLKQGQVYLGNPARPKAKAIEQELSASRLPYIRKNIKALSEKVEQLAKKIKQQENT